MIKRPVQRNLTGFSLVEMTGEAVASGETAYNNSLSGAGFGASKRGLHMLRQITTDHEAIVSKPLSREFSAVASSSIFDDVDMALCELLHDSTVKDRVFGHSLADRFVAMVSRGRLSYFHSLILPNDRRGTSEAFAAIMLDPAKRNEFLRFQSVVGDAILSAMLRCEPRCGRKSAEVVWFEHGNASGDSAIKCGTRVAHMHGLVTTDRSAFRRSLIAQMNADCYWEAMRAEDGPAAYAERSVEYLYVQLGEEAWGREIRSTARPTRQYLRKIVRDCVAATGMATPQDWVWQNVDDDAPAAIKEASLLKGELGLASSMEASTPMRAIEQPAKC